LSRENHDGRLTAEILGASTEDATIRVVLNVANGMACSAQLFDDVNNVWRGERTEGATMWVEVLARQNFKGSREASARDQARSTATQPMPCLRRPSTYSIPLVRL